MRHFLISALLLSLLAGCSSVKLGPHRIDVQQGNALDQENVARLKLGLNRSQVRFLLGTPLVVDPFRTDRWDYVYVYYKAGKLAEQKRITLFFDGETLARIEGDLPEPAAQPVAPAIEPRPEPQPAPMMPAAPATMPAASVSPQPERVMVMAAPKVTVAPASEPVAPVPVAAPAVATAAPTPAPAPVQSPKASPAVAAAVPESSVVAPLPSPKNAPAYIDPRPSAELSLQPETNVEQIRPDVIPPFPESPVAGGGDAPVLQAVNEWATAWARRDITAYFAAYDDRFVPQDGRSRADWETRKRQALGAAKNIEVRIESPSVEHAEEGTATVTFQQFYRAGSYRDAVVKQLLLVERDGRWLIAEEKVLSTLGGARP